MEVILVKNFFVACLVVLMVPFMFSATFNVNNEDTLNNAEINSAYSATEVKIDENAIVSARLLHMLNINNCYGQDFESDAKLIEDVQLSLLDYSIDDEQYGRIISKSIVSSFIEDFYGVDVDQTAGEYENFPAPDSFFAIPARGYTVFKHSIVSVKSDGDIYTVVSAVNIDSHDGDSFNALVNSTFAKNSSSSFGFNLVSSEIL